MLKKIGAFFAEPPAKEPIQDDQQVASMYKHWRWRIFYSSFIAYVVFHLCRKNIAVALPSMGKALSLSNTQLGILGSTLYVTYGIGKFINGVIADKSNVRTFLPTALILSAICNICFVLSAIFVTPGHVSFFGLPSATILLWLLSFFWGANGWFQSCGFPPVAKSLSYWFSNSERGTKWSIWSTSHQIGVFASVALSGLVIDRFGWMAAFYVPAIICLITGIWLFDRLRDKPQTLGLPDIEKYNNEPVKEVEKDEQSDVSYIQIFKKHILCNPIIWMLAISYTFVYIISLLMIPYGYWAFVKLNGSSIGVWITMSILMLIVFGYTLYTGRYLRANDLYNSNLIDARQKVAKAKKLDSDWLKFGIPAGLLWIIYFIYDKYQQISDDSFWIFAASMTIACILGVLIGLKIHYRNQDNYQEIVDQIEELTQE